MRGPKSQTLGRQTAVSFREEKKTAECLKLMQKWGFGLSKKEVLETIGRYVNENKIHKPCRGGVHGDDFFICSKITHKLSLKKQQSFESCRKDSYLPNHNF